MTKFNANGCWFQAILGSGETKTIISLDGLLRFLRIHNPSESHTLLLDWAWTAKPGGVESSYNVFYLIALDPDLDTEGHLTDQFDPECWDEFQAWNSERTKHRDAWTRDPLLCMRCGSADRVLVMLWVNALTGKADWSEPCFEVTDEPHSHGIQSRSCTTCKADHGVTLTSEIASVLALGAGVE